MSHKFLGLALVMLIAVPFAVPAVAQTEDAAPTPTFTHTQNPVVYDAIAFDANVVDEDPANVTYAWDLDYDGENFTVDATGETLEHVFETAGVHVVALRATDAADQSAIVARNVRVDDFFTVHISFVYPPERESAIFAHLRVENHDGEGVGEQPVTIGVFYQPQRDGYALPIRTLTATTEENGEKFFPIPRDTSLGNLPGRHLMTVNAQIKDTVLGDTESVTIRVAYAVPHGL